MTTTDTPLTLLLAQREQAKVAEDAAIAERRRLDFLIAHHPDVESNLVEEGTASLTVGNYKLSVATGYTRRWDQKKLMELRPSIRDAFWPFRLKYDEDRRAARRIEETEPDLWAILSPALTLTPRTPTIAKLENTDGN